MNIRQLWNNYKLVQWEDGTYGIRKGWLFHRFKDFSTACHDYWWEEGRWNKDIKVSKEKATTALDVLLKGAHTVRLTYEIVEGG